ncbi:MAG: metal-sensitive transcriptional regulator [Patescibacteria group bacterium]
MSLRWKSSGIKSALRRLNVIRGQLNGLVRMVENDKYCVDIITQSSAIKEALSGVEHLILENHLSTHVLEQMKNGRERQAVDEILKVYKLAQKKK